MTIPRGRIKRKKKHLYLFLRLEVTDGFSQRYQRRWSFPPLWHPEATLSASGSFPVSPSPLSTELTEQVINSGATTPNLSCCQGCLPSPCGGFCAAPSALAFSTNESITEKLLDCVFLCVCHFFPPFFLNPDHLL